MIDARTLSYAYNEEANGFEEPSVSGSEDLSFGAKICLAIVGGGILAVVVQTFGGLFAGSWPGLLLGFGATTAGAVSYFLISNDPTPDNKGMYFKNLTSRGGLAWIAGIFMTGFYVLLYWFPASLDQMARLVDPLSIALSGGAANQWFLYGFLYTLAIFIFGVRTLMRYRESPAQQIRTISVIVFQMGFAFLIPHILKKLNQPEFYFSYFWPLKYDYLFPGTVSSIVENPGGLGIFLVFWGAMMTFVATPILTYYFGKRWYCSWVCGCGGLAETMGDPWRHLSDRSEKAWKVEKWMIHSVLVLITIITVLLWVNSSTSGAVFGGISHSFSKWYGFFIGALFSGVIGVGFYPIMGTRVWCRFGCPMAAILGILQRFFSKFRITINGGQCMECGICSTYCEMGIDVRSYAQRGENITRASCVGCGICEVVCPRGVLKLENGATPADRYKGAEKPIDALLADIRKETRAAGFTTAAIPKPTKQAVSVMIRGMRDVKKRPK